LNASMIAARASAQQDPEQFASIAKEFETIANQVNELAVQTNQSLVLLQQRTDRIQTVVSGVDDDAQEITGLVERFTLGVARSRQVLNNIQAVTEQVAQVGAQVTQSSQAIAEAARITLGTIDDIATETEQQSRFTRDKAEGMDRLARILLEKVQFFRLPANLDKDEAVAQALSFTAEDDTVPDLVKIS
jgi:methyl-accepting chemotaxis protein PixJ